MASDRVMLLDENTANQIAAGEVVERPASAVKELVENSIDAGATQILVALEEGGKQAILVSDNGCGMTRSDAILALQRHATSKIRTADDLFAIHTLGFRGEAMPSIASVSRMTLTTKPADEESGTCLVVSGGDVQSLEEVAARDGTTIEVRQLFFNTPARLKFLKSTPTEVARTVEIVGQLAISYPQIAFRLKNGAQEVFSTPGTGEPLAALAAVWGRDCARKLIPIRHDALGLNVSGYVATPDISRPGRSHELIFVNRRPIKSRLIAHALEEAFRSLTPDSRYPIGAIFVEIHPDMVDVNVHPTKTEVKFTRDGEVHHAVSQAVKGALLAYGIVPQARIAHGSVTLPIGESGLDTRTGLDAQSAFQFVPATSSPLSPLVPSGARTGSPLDEDVRAFAAILSGFAPAESLPGSVPLTGVSFPAESEAGVSSGGGIETEATVSVAHNAVRTSSDSSTMVNSNPESNGVEPISVEQDSISEAGKPVTSCTVEANLACSADVLQVPPRPKPFADQLREFRVLGQARNTYIIALTPNGIAVIDQHVAHERVLYERLTVQRFSNGIPVQRLAIPITVQLPRREALLLEEHCNSFTRAGWDIAAFGKDSFVVRSIPAMLVRKPYEQILRDMIDELVNQTVSRRLLVQQEHVTITNACKLAVKAGDPMEMEEMVGLLAQLAETENPYLCPHGRPIVVTIPFHELDKQFKRA